MSGVKQDFSGKKCENQQVQVIVTASDTRKVAISIMYFQAKKIYCQRLSFHSKKKQWTGTSQKEEVFDRLNQMIRPSDDVKNASFRRDEKTNQKLVSNTHFSTESMCNNYFPFPLNYWKKII